MLYPNLIVLNSLFEEYIDNRVKQAESTYFGIIANAISSTLSKENSIDHLREFCGQFSKDLSVANKESAEQKADSFLDLSIRLGDTGLEAEKIHYTTGPSVFAKKAHVARTYIINSPALKYAKAKRIEKFENELIAVKEQITAQITTLNKEEKLPARQAIQKTIDTLHIERDRLLRHLAYIGKPDHIAVLSEVEREALFPKLKYPEKDVNSLATKFHNKTFNLNLAIPVELHPNYHEIYAYEESESSFQELHDRIIEKFCDKYGLPKSLIFQVYQNIAEEKQSNSTVTSSPQLSHAVTTMTPRSPNKTVSSEKDSSRLILTMFKESGVASPTVTHEHTEDPVLSHPTEMSVPEPIVAPISIAVPEVVKEDIHHEHNKPRKSKKHR